MATVAQVQPSYDAAGNVATLSTSFGAIPGVTGTGGNETQAFCYDEQDRLTWASTQTSGPCGRAGSEGLSGAGYTASYAYDALGRMTSASVLTPGGLPVGGAAQGSYAYGDSAHVHAITAVGSGGTTSESAAYDAAGAMTCRALTSASCTTTPATGQALTYDALRRLTAWQNGASSSESYAYDGEGTRVWRQTTSGAWTTTTVAILGMEEVTTSSLGGAPTATRFYALPGGVRATRDRTGLVYEANDQLGTPIASLNLTSGIVGEQLRAPYGQARYGAAASGGSGGLRTPYGFTGQREDTTPAGSSGLDDFNARMYDPVVGRFTSADDAQPGLGDPSGQDGYAYVGGRVENATDPSGHAQCDEQCFSGGGPSQYWPNFADTTRYIHINATEQGGAPGLLGYNGGGMADAVGTAMGNGVTVALGGDTIASFDGDGGVKITGPDGTVIERAGDATQIAGPDPLAVNRAGVHDPTGDEPPAGPDSTPPAGPDTPPSKPPSGPDTSPSGPDTPPAGGDTTATNPSSPGEANGDNGSSSGNGPGNQWNQPASNQTRVGRWIWSQHAGDYRTGYLPQIPQSNYRIYVGKPGFPRPGGAGSLYVEFNVPTAAVQGGGKAGWFFIDTFGVNIPIDGVVFYP